MTTPTSRRSPETAGRTWRPVPGPVDREHFFAAQARNRRATWRLGALCVLGLVLMGIPMSAVMTPLVLAAVLLVTGVVNLLVPVPDLLSMLGAGGEWPPPGGLSDLAAGAVVAGFLLVPGALAMAAVWLGARGLFRRAGPEALVRALGGRPARDDDPEERQLGNVVAEMAIAAGVQPPRVMLLDGPVANAAALGSSPEDAVVLVSRRLLDELDRDETQGVVAHLVGAIGNGDLRVALSTIALSRTIALVITALGATFGPVSRQALGRVLRLARGRTPEGASLDELLGSAADLNDQDLDRLHRRTSLLDLLRFPFLMAHFAIWLSRLAFMSFVVGPALALLWRSRRYLADATAVQLTRHPDGIARALAALSARGGPVPGAGWAAPLFIVGPGSGRGGLSGHGAPTMGLMGDDFGFLAFDPPMAPRLARLRRQGASVDLAVPPLRLSPLVRLVLALFLVPVGAALLGCALAITWVALAINVLCLAPVLALLQLVLRVWPGN